MGRQGIDFLKIKYQRTGILMVGFFRKILDWKPHAIFSVDIIGPLSRENIFWPEKNRTILFWKGHFLGVSI